MIKVAVMYIIMVMAMIMVIKNMFMCMVKLKELFKQFMVIKLEVILKELFEVLFTEVLKFNKQFIMVVVKLID